jgi:hypothetical protein
VARAANNCFRAKARRVEIAVGLAVGFVVNMIDVSVINKGLTIRKFELFGGYAVQ